MRLLLVGWLLLTASAGAQSFTYTAGPMQQARAQQTATLLPDGQVLLAGGTAAGQPLASAEIFDPAHSTFQLTGSMTRARSGATAQPLPDGRVLILGGEPEGVALSSDIYDPASGTFTRGPGLPFALTEVASAPLADGRVLVSGVAGGSGCAPGICRGVVEIFDAASGQFTAGGQLQLARSGATVTALANGEVLIFNGWDLNVADAAAPSDTYEIYDPATSASTLFVAATAPVAGAAAVRLNDGTVLICGGSGAVSNLHAACELFDPATHTVGTTAGAMEEGRSGATATLLADGRVLIAGGNRAAPDAEIYDPPLGTFSPAGNFNAGREDFSATRLGDGSVLVAGGSDGGASPRSLASAEIFQPGSAAADFALSSNANVVTVTTVSSASFQITAQASDGFAGTIALVCTGTGAAVCTLAPPSLLPGATSTVTVSGFDTSQSGDFDFQVVGSSGGLRHSLTLRVAIAPPGAQLLPGGLDLGTVSLGAASLPQTVTLTNAGGGTLHLRTISTRGDFAESNNCGATLAPGAQCAISVTFQPTAAGARSGVLELVDDAPDSPQTVALSGEGQNLPAPAVTLAPPQLNFGQQPVGVTSSAQLVTLTNTGFADLTFFTLAVTGDFSASSNCPTTVITGASCTITVAFTPMAAGARVGQLQVQDDAPASPQTVALAGSGLTGLAPGAALAPARLIFPDQPLGIVSAAQTVTLTNAGTASLVIAGVAASGDFAATTDCGASLAPGQSCSMAVSFTPSALGTRSGQLAVSDNAGGSPQTVALSGNGIAASGPASSQVTLAPAAGGFDSATVDAGRNAVYNLTVQSTTGFTGNLNLACTGAPAGATCTVQPLAVTLAAALTPIIVTVTTSAAGSVLAAPAAPGWGWLLVAAGLMALLPRRRKLAAAVGVWILACGLAACGGTTALILVGPTPTPPGTYQLNVTATAASSNTPAGAIVLTLVVR